MSRQPSITVPEYAKQCGYMRRVLRALRTYVHLEETRLLTYDLLDEWAGVRKTIAITDVQLSQIRGHNTYSKANEWKARYEACVEFDTIILKGRAILRFPNMRKDELTWIEHDIKQAYKAMQALEAIQVPKFS